MSTDTVIIEDDDVEMEPIVVLDEDDDKISTEKSPCPQIVETIDLDDEQSSEPETMDYETEQAFVRKLEINRLMDKIVTTCMHMENAVGMPRVIHKTLLPLYRDASNTVKESEEFKKLLKRTWKLLVKDPNHKFLHIKTLCEELKWGQLRRKVPFVTLTTELPHRKSGLVTELNSSSRQINTNNIQIDEENSSDVDVESIDVNEIDERRSERIKKIVKEQKKCGAAMKKKLTAYSSHYTTKMYNQNRKRYAMAKKRKLNGIHMANSAKLHKLRKQCATAMKRKFIKTRNLDIGYEKTDIINLDNSDNEPEDSQTNHENVNIMLSRDKIEKNELEHTLQVEAMNSLNEDTENTMVLDEDSNKENDQSENNVSKISNEDTDELLVPQNHVEVTIDNAVTYNRNADLERIKVIEKDIAFYKKRIAKLEEAEVTTDNGFSSPYIQCAKLKRRIVDCYKEICEINGNCDELVKRREIRMHVSNGHPSGPAKRLEQYLNDTIDNTGAVAFPDFSDVVKCVLEANREDSLGWSRQQVFQEASALFRQCGQALRKRRQKREYRDLLSLVRDKTEPDDPAENDPELLAKLEENKLIAKIKEEEILERYVNMEKQIYSASAGGAAGSNGEPSMMEFESDRDSSDSDSDNEDNTITPDDVAPDIINYQCEIGQCSKTDSFNNNFSAAVSNNSLIITPIATSDQVNVTDISNNVDVSVNVNPSSFNPLLTRLLQTPFVEPQCALIEEAGSRNIVRESSSVNKNYAEVAPIVDNLDKHIKTEKIIYNNLDTVTSSSNSFNNIKIEEPDDPNPNDDGLTVTPNHNSNHAAISDRIKFCDVKVTIEDVKVKKETKPVDVQGMLDELGDSFVCTVFDFEDPFLVIEISSDGFSEDEL